MIEVRAPATSANLGSGFDVFGVALDKPVDIVRVEKSDKLSIEVNGFGSDFIPEDPDKNTAGIVAKEMGANVRITIDKGIRPSSGLGSSAASAAGAAVGINEALSLDMSMDELIDISSMGEKAVSGTQHKDNVAPCIAGGFTIVSDSVVSLPAEFHCVVVLPEFPVSTNKARDVLPSSVSLRQRSETVANAAKVVAGILRDDIDLLSSGMKDKIIEQARSPLIKGYSIVKQKALDAGAKAITISGGGPALMAVCTKNKKEDVAKALIDGFSQFNIDSRAYQVRIGEGTQIISR